MAVTTANLLKMLVPIFSAIGGVFVTSSLVSKSAEEQEKEKPLTKLKDEDPIIEEYEDANEGECKKSEGKECKGGQPSPQGQKGDGGGSGSPTEGSSTDSSGSQAQGEDNNFQENSAKDIDSDESGPQNKEEDGEKGSQSENGDSDQDSGSEDKKDGTEDGDENSEHAHAAGTKFGTVDRRMTKEEIGSLTNMSSSLVDITSRLNAMLKAE